MSTPFVHDTWSALYKSVEWNEVQEKHQLCCHWIGRWRALHIHASTAQVNFYLRISISNVSEMVQGKVFFFSVIAEIST